MNTRPLVILAMLVLTFLPGCGFFESEEAKQRRIDEALEKYEAARAARVAAPQAPASAPVAQPAVFSAELEAPNPAKQITGKLETQPGPTPDIHLVLVNGQRTWVGECPNRPHSGCQGVQACSDGHTWTCVPPGAQVISLEPAPAAPAPKSTPVPALETPTTLAKYTHGEVEFYSDLNGWDAWPIRDANKDGWYEVAGSTDHQDAHGVVIGNGPVRFTFRHRCTSDCTDKCCKWARIASARCRAYGEDFQGGDLALALMFDAGTVAEVPNRKGVKSLPVVSTPEWAYVSPEVRVRHRAGCTFCKEEGAHTEWHEYDLELAGAILTPCQEACKQHATAQHSH